MLSARSIRRKEAPMRLTGIAVAGLVAGTLLTASPAQAMPSFPLSPQSDAEDVRQQIADLDAVWDSLTPGQRNQRFTQIQQGLTKLDFETRNVPQDQKAGVDLILLPAPESSDRTGLVPRHRFQPADPVLDRRVRRKHRADPLTRTERIGDHQMRLARQLRLGG
jgi:hypothetical protein